MVSEFSSPFKNSNPPIDKIPVTNPISHLSASSRNELLGSIEVFEPHHFSLVFETKPWWLLSLEPDQVSSLSFPQFSSENEIVSVLKSNLFGHVLSSVFSNTDKNFQVPPRFSSTFLINGSANFVKESLKKYATNEDWIFVLDQVQKYRSLPCSSLQLHRARHSLFGGATTAEIVWGSSNVAFKLNSSKLLRKIGDFIDYSIRPTTLAASFQSSSCIHFSKLLPISSLSASVFHPTSYSATGFGIRSLELSELGQVFGLPKFYCRFLHQSELPFPPSQICSALLAQFSKSLHRPSYPLIRPFVPQIPISLPVPNDQVVILETLGRPLPQDWCQIGEIVEKAAKADNAQVDFRMWNERILSLWPTATKLIELLRPFVLRVLKRKLYLEFLRYLKRTYGSVYAEYMQTKYLVMSISGSTEQLRGEEKPKVIPDLNLPKYENLRFDIECGIQVLTSYQNSSFFGWDNGSTLIFWRWNHYLQHYAKSGFPAQIASDLPRNFRYARKPKREVHDKLFSKIKKGMQRNYLKITPRQKIKNLIGYFAVPKAEDIRMVQNGSSCGLNEATWSSNFWLPNSSSMVRVLGFNYKAVDIDLGEMFLNFPLDNKLVAFSGMDITPFTQEIKACFPNVKLPDQEKVFVTNTRCWMGLRPSPEWSCRFYYLAEEFVRGDERSQNNPLFWDKLILNLIGSPDYNPAMPNVFKWNSVVQRMAGEIKAYVDDLRALGWSLEHVWKIARWVASRLQYLGIQDAARKRRIDNGPWAGCVYITTPSKVQRTVTKEKWNKGRNYLIELNKLIYQQKLKKLNFNYLERVRGFLCHLAMTFEVIFPFLKGFHLTLCSYLPKRSGEGWKIKDLEWIAFLEQEKIEGRMSEEEVDLIMKFKYDPKNRPNEISLVPRFYSCLTALTLFFESETPPIITDRSSEISLLVYGFVDASKSGFGASLDYKNDVRYRIGVWGPDEDDASSNFREFANLVETLEVEVDAGRLKDAYVIMATDNSTVESALHKGNSSSEKLFGLITRFKALELKSGSKFLVTHVSGNRMQVQGTDGISRGSLREGVSLGKSMLRFCPWSKSALERSPELKSWITAIIGPKLEILKPEDWFGRGHDHFGGEIDNLGFYRLKIKTGIFLWHPPPAAADVALEEIRKARLKRRRSTHIVLIPKLATTLWLRQLYKAADFVLTIPPIHSFWSSQMFESCFLAFIFPYSRAYPWQLRNTPKLIGAQREMRRLFKTTDVAPGDILRKFYSSTERIPTLPARLVRKVLYFGSTDKISCAPARRTIKQPVRE